MGSLEGPDCSVTMDTAYSKLEVMIRNYTREKLNLDNKINTLQRDIEVYGEALKEKDQLVKNLQIEKDRYRQIHEEDENMRFTFETMVMSCEQKINLLLKSLDSLQCNVEFNHDKYCGLMNVNQSMKKRQLLLEELCRRERCINQEMASKLEKYEKRCHELENTASQYLLEKETVTNEFNGRLNTLQASYSKLEEARIKEQHEHEEEIAKLKEESNALHIRLEEQYRKEKCYEQETALKLEDYAKRCCEMQDTASKYLTEKENLAKEWTERFNALQTSYKILEEARDQQQLQHEEEIAKIKEESTTRQASLEEQCREEKCRKEETQLKLEEFEKCCREMEDTVSQYLIEKENLIKQWTERLDELQTSYASLEETRTKEQQEHQEEIAKLKEESSALQALLEEQCNEEKCRKQETALKLEEYEKRWLEAKNIASQYSSEKENLAKEWNVRFNALQTSYKNLEKARNKEQHEHGEEIARIKEECNTRYNNLEKKYTALLLEKKELEKERRESEKQKIDWKKSEKDKDTQNEKTDLEKEKKESKAGTQDTKKVSFFGFSSQSSSSDDTELNAILSKKTNGILSKISNKRSRTTEDKDFVPPKEKKRKETKDERYFFSKVRPASSSTPKAGKKVY